MKKITVGLAMIGFLIIAGALGNDDVMIMTRGAYPMIYTLRSVAFGMLLIIPAIVRGVVYGTKKYS